LNGWRASALFVPALLVSASAAASVPDHYGFGSRSSAMAGAVCADVVDFSAGYYNPAGMAEAPGVEVAVGYMYTVQSLLVDGKDNDVDDVHGLVAGVLAPGELFGIPFAFGMAIHLPDDGISFIKARRQGVPRWELYDTRSQLMYLEASVAVRPLDWMELGGGIGYLSATTGDFSIRGRADIISPYNSKLEHEVDADLTAVRYPQAGLRFMLEDWGAIGLTYRGQSKLDLNLEAHLEGIVDFAGIDVPLLYELEARTIASFTPRQGVIGVSFQRFEDLRLNVDVTWMNWSAYESPTAQIQAAIEIEPPPGTPVSLPDSPAPTDVIAPRFEDRFVPRIGIEYLGVGFGEERKVHGEDKPLFEMPVRVGYVYEESPVPNQTGLTNLIDTDSHTLTLGLGFQLNGPMEEIPGSIILDAHAAFTFLPERTFEKENAADFVGDHAASGSMYGGGGTLRVVF
jgi:long-chain fatty acid transport protein